MCNVANGYFMIMLQIDFLSCLPAYPPSAPPVSVNILHVRTYVLC